MQLSGEAFRQIVMQLKGACGKSDKRSKPRVGMRNHVMLSLFEGAKGSTAQRKGAAGGGPAGGMQQVEVMIRDLSPGGICIVHTVRLPAKTLFAIQLPVAGQRNLKAIYVVKHCEPLDAGLFRIGAALLKLDDPQGIVSMSHPNLMGKAEGKAESKGPAAGAEDAETPEKAKLAEAVLAGK